MIKRKGLLSTLLKEFPAVAIIGPRQVGKTTLAQSVAKLRKKNSLYLDLELESDRRKLDDMEAFFKAHRDKLIILDEVQFMPSVFTALRPEIDALRKAGRFILTGSADPALIKGVAESLAGRIAYLPLHPIGLHELPQNKYEILQHWFRGGYPSALLAKSHTTFHRWTENYIQTFVERDLRMIFDTNLPAPVVRNCWTMIANNNGGLLNTEKMASALGISGPTVKRYLQFLEGAFLIRQLQPWHSNSGKRLTKSPKVYVRDSGILHHLTHIESPSNLPGNLVVGASWEGYVIEQIIQSLPSGIYPCFYRTQHGAEVDLVLVKNNKAICSIEIKHSLAPTLSAGFYHATEDLECKANYVIYTGDFQYQNKEKVVIIGLRAFLNSELDKIAST